jgi:hypothetical protein
MRRQGYREAKGARNQSPDQNTMGNLFQLPRQSVGDVHPAESGGQVNRRQIRAARLIVATLILAACASDTPISTLPRLMASATFDHWRTIAFQAGVPVPDEGVKKATIALLEGML